MAVVLVSRRIDEALAAGPSIAVFPADQNGRVQATQDTLRHDVERDLASAGVGVSHELAREIADAAKAAHLKLITRQPPIAPATVAAAVEPPAAAEQTSAHR